MGEIMGQSKPINSVDFRAERPFRIVTASEDNTIAYFHGPPFKFQFTLQVNCTCVNACILRLYGYCSEVLTVLSTVISKDDIVVSVFIYCLTSVLLIESCSI